MVGVYGRDWVQWLNKSKREVVKRRRPELEDELARLKAQAKQLEAEVPV
jgi:uncharacterized protein YlxW (UPF0749 family)